MWNKTLFVRDLFVRLHEDERGDVGVVQVAAVAVGVLILAALLLFAKEIGSWLREVWDKIRTG